jgi:hypothetical protein
VAADGKFRLFFCQVLGLRRTDARAVFFDCIRSENEIIGQRKQEKKQDADAPGPFTQSFVGLRVGNHFPRASSLSRLDALQKGSSAEKVQFGKKSVCDDQADSQTLWRVALEKLLKNRVLCVGGLFLEIW